MPHAVDDANEFTAQTKNSQSKLTERIRRRLWHCNPSEPLGPASQQTPVPLHRWCGAAAAGAVGAPPSPKIRPDTRCLTLPRTNSSCSIQCALGSPGPRVGTRAQRCSRPPVMYSRPPDCASQRTGAPILLPPQTHSGAPPGPLQTELCSTWIRSGGCPYGHKCQFAHGVDELRARQALLATRSPNHLRRTLSDPASRRTNPLHTRPRSAGRSHEAADAPTVPGAALCTATSWRRSSSLCCDSWTRVRRCSCS